MDDEPYAAVVLAGGSGRRLGGADKPALELAGRSLLQRVLDGLDPTADVTVVGPERDGVAGVRWVREDPPGAGPRAALAAGLAAVDRPVTVVLAGDQPWIAPALPALLGAVAGGAPAAVVLQADGRRNPLAAAWDTTTLRRALDAPGRSLQDLFADLAVVEVPDLGGWSDDVDTPDDLAAARRRARP